MFSLLVCLACTGLNPGIDTLKTDIETAWTSNQPNYHRFLSAAFGLVQKSMDGQEVRKVYRSLQRQGVLFDPEVNAQKYVWSEPVFKFNIGGLTHQVGMKWFVRQDPTQSEPERRRVIGTEVELVAKHKVRFDEFAKASPYPGGSVVNVVLHREDLRKAALEFPYLESISITYDRASDRWDPPETGHGCQFEVVVELATGVTDLAVRRHSRFYVPSGLDRPLTDDGNPLPDPFESKDTLGKVVAHINSGGWGRLTEDSVGFMRIGSTPYYDSEDSSCSAHTVDDLTSLPDTIESLFMSGHDFGEHGHELLARFRRLKSLTIWNVDFTSEQLSVIGALPNLEELDIANISVDDRVLSSLASAKNLRILQVNAPLITDKGVAALAQLGNLQDLALNGCDHLSTDFAKQLARFPSLTKLKVSVDAGPAKMITDIARLTRLEKLSLSGFSNVRPESFLSLMALKSLKSLTIERSSVDDRFLKQIPSTWPSIRTLHFDDDPAITNRGAVSLGSLKLLDWLCFYRCQNVTKLSTGPLAKLLGPGFEH